MDDETIGLLAMAVFLLTLTGITVGIWAWIRKDYHP